MIVTKPLAGRILVIFCLVVLSPLSAWAQETLKIGFVNASEILDKAPQAEQARERLEAEFAPRDQEVIDGQRSLRQMEDQLAAEGPELNAIQRRKIAREINSQKREIKRLREEFQDDFNIRRNEELTKLQRLVYDAIVALAKEEQFDLIVNDGAVIYAGEKVDITEKVLNRLQ